MSRAAVRSSDELQKFCKSYNNRIALYTFDVYFEMSENDTGVLINFLKSPKNNCLYITFLSPVTKTHWSKICDAIRESNIYSIALCSSGFTDEYGVLLAKAIHGNSSVVNVDFEGAEVSDETAIAMAEVIQHPNCAITRLSFYANDVTTRGMVALAEATKINRSISVLELHKNAGDASSFAASLEHNYRIRLQGDPASTPSLRPFTNRNVDFGYKLISAAQQNDTEEMKRLLQLGVHLDSGILENCVQYGEDVLKVLLQEPLIKRNINASRVGSALQQACLLGKVTEAAFLIEHGSKLRNCDFDPLFHVVDSKNLDLINLFTWAGADWNEVLPINTKHPERWEFTETIQSAREYLEKTYSESEKIPALKIIDRKATRKQTLLFMLCVFKYGKDTIFAKLPNDVNKIILGYVDSLRLERIT